MLQELILFCFIVYKVIFFNSFNAVIKLKIERFKVSIVVRFLVV